MRLEETEQEIKTPDPAQKKTLLQQNIERQKMSWFGNLLRVDSSHPLAQAHHQK